jgi:hypothetical protein
MVEIDIDNIDTDMDIDYVSTDTINSIDTNLDRGISDDSNPILKWFGNRLLFISVIIGIILILIIGFTIFAISNGHPKAVIVNGTTTSNNVECKLVNGQPDILCTPGSIVQVPSDGLCSETYLQSEISIPIDEQTILNIYSRYGIVNTDGWSIQHKIPIILGGSNDITNLYPMTAEPRPGYIERDKAAQKLKQLMCDKKISLEVAQYTIQNTWQASKGLYS